jgi:hypothetical protein
MYGCAAQFFLGMPFEDCLFAGALCLSRRRKKDRKEKHHVYQTKSCSSGLISAPLPPNRTRRAKSAMQLGVPALTAGREWKNVKVKGLKVEHIR